MTRDEMRQGFRQGRVLTQERERATPSEVRDIESLAEAGYCELSPWFWSERADCEVRTARGLGIEGGKVARPDAPPSTTFEAWKRMSDGAPRDGTAILMVYTGPPLDWLPAHPWPMVMRWSKLQPGAMHAWNSAPVAVQVQSDDEGSWLWCPLPALPAVAPLPEPPAPVIFGRGLKRRMIA